MRYAALLVVLYLVHLPVNGYILTGNEWLDFNTWDDTELANYTILQSAGMQGRILCNGKPFKRAMRLVAQDVGVFKAFTTGANSWNDGLYENEATDDGAFFRLSGWAPRHQVRGSTTGKSEIYLHVYHRCVQNESAGPWQTAREHIVPAKYKDFDFKRNCVRMYKSDSVPDRLVFGGTVPEKIYDIGTIDLAVEDDSNYACGGCGGWFPIHPERPADKRFEEPRWGCDEEFP